VWAAAAGVTVVHAEKKQLQRHEKKYPVEKVERPCAPIYRGKGILHGES